MKEYFHAVEVNQQRCIGCTQCLRVCPTQALRIRKGKALILEHNCIDCGECMRVCPTKAIHAKVDPLESTKEYTHKLLVFSTVMLGQFKVYKDYKKVIGFFKALGFDRVIGVDVGSFVLADLIREYLQVERSGKRPLISTSCPAVIRLIQVRFPSLVSYIFPFRSMMDISGSYLKQQYIRDTGADPKDVGLFFASPCPSKVVAVYQPEGESERMFDRVLSLGDVYNEIRLLMEKNTADIPECDPLTTKNALRWSALGDPERSFPDFMTLRIDGINNVIKFLERMENGVIKDVDFVDLYSCDKACVGGVFTKEDSFFSAYKIRQIADMLPETHDSIVYDSCGENNICEIPLPIEPRPLQPIDTDIKKALQKMKRIQEINGELPQLNCGMCGCPTCYALAEDIVLTEQLSVYDCPVVLRKHLRSVANDMFKMVGHVNPIEDEDSPEAPKSEP